MHWLQNTSITRRETLAWAFIFTIFGGFLSYWTGLFVTRIINFNRNRLEATTQFIRTVNKLMELGFFGLTQLIEKDGKQQERTKTRADVHADIGFTQLLSHLNAFVRDQHTEPVEALKNAIALTQRYIEILMKEKCLNSEAIEALHKESQELADALLLAKPRKRTFFSPLWKYL